MVPFDGMLSGTNGIKTLSLIQRVRHYRHKVKKFIWATIVVRHDLMIHIYWDSEAVDIIVSALP